VPFLLGLTGNIACGKSTVGRLLAERYGADYVDADSVVHARYAADTPETAAIAERFGSNLRQSDGTIDRRRLGDIVMADESARLDLEQILYPGVRKAILERVDQSRAAVVVLDAIRLIESGLVDRCDAVWVVTCSRASQEQRLRASRGFSKEQVALRIDAQTPQSAKVARATCVLTNDGSFEDLDRQVASAWSSLPSPFGRGQGEGYFTQSSAP
jgi:dephospho-CoA kinase